MASILTLMTDFGLKDGNVGVMKGVILGIAPQTRIIDLSHTISPQDVIEAALILHRSVPYFPPGSVHVVVVDPGVGTARRPMAAELDGQYFVGPDNGLITRWLERVEREGKPARFFHLNQQQYWLPEISHVFHGRDIFAPSAAHLVTGVPLEKLGSSILDPVRLALPQPERTARGWRARIIHIDHFGNLSTNLYSEHLTGQQITAVHIGSVTIHGIVRTFGERPQGELVALFGSTGNLIISVVNGNAALHLKATVGDLVNVSVA